MMVRSIFVPLDGSAFGEQALPLARQIALRSGATITLAHVHVPIIDVFVGEWSFGGMPIVDERMDADQRAYERTYLESLRARVAGDATTVTCALLDGPVVTTLVEYAAAIHADLVVMTTHGHGGFSRVWLGSIADAFVRHCTIPTLLIRPTIKEEPIPRPVDQPGPIQRILIPLDGSALAERVLEPACTLGDTLGVEYWLLRVVEPFQTNGSTSWLDRAELEHEFVRPRHSEAHTYLADVAAVLRAQGRTIHTQVVIAHQPARVILTTAVQHDIDLVALATHGRRGVQRLFLGSVADKVVRGAEMPVLLLRPDAHPGESTGR